MKKTLALILTVLLGFNAVSAATSKGPLPAPALTIDLATLGYPAETQPFSDTDIFADRLTHFTFVSESVLAVYFTRPKRETDEGDLPRRLEVFFVDINSGKLIEHRTWKTLRKQWSGDGYDTEGTICAVRGGFLVQANATLQLYSHDLRLLKSLDLRASTAKSSAMWSVKSAPGGDMIQVQPGSSLTQVHHGAISWFEGGDSGASIWLRSDTFEQIGTQTYFPGDRTVSENSIVAQRFDCLDIMKRSGEPTRHLYCPEHQGVEYLEFLTNDEIIISLNTQFVVLSTQGAEIWKAGEPDPGVSNRRFYIGLPIPSMDGSRFAVYLTPYKRHSDFDGVRLRKGFRSVFVYDGHSRQHIFVAAVDKKLMELSALSTNGATLAIKVGKTVAVYKLPPA